MRAILPFIFLVSHLSKLVTSNEDSSDIPCRARAWVRAPNLELGQVVQGQVRVKLDGACDNVSSYSLGLRFAERSWVKTLREGATLPLKPFPGGCCKILSSRPSNSDGSLAFDPNQIDWDSWTAPEADMSVWDRYESEIKNPDLWLIREEERIAFDTRYRLVDEDNQEPSRDIVQPFALLVPFTAYPPGFDMLSGYGSSGGENLQAAGSENIYKYYVDVTFSNGTHREVDAGYTSFNSALGAVTEVASGSKVGRESVYVTATNIFRKESCSGNALEENTLEGNDTIPLDTFTLEVIFPNGRHFEKGSINNITIISHQLGPGVQRPLSIDHAITSVKQRHHWAARHAANNESAEALLYAGDGYSYELQPKDNDEYDDRLNGWDNPPQFSQDGVIQNGIVFSTEAATVPFEVPRHIYPPFEMYYQTSEVELLINMQVRNASERGLPPGILDEDEYDWVPTIRRDGYYDTEYLEATIPIMVHSTPEHSAKPDSGVVHYLSPEAREPIFADPSYLPEMMEMTAEELNSLAPFAKAKIIPQADGDMVEQRYHEDFSGNDHYVGDTWLRKVVIPAKGKDADEDMADRILVTNSKFQKT